MGTDARYFVEHKKEGKWEYVPEIECDPRDYQLFGLLANVRVHDLPLIGERLKITPKDLSPHVYDFNISNCDWDSAWGYGNWLSLQELVDFDWNALFREGEAPDWDESFTGEKGTYTYADRFNYFIEGMVEPMKALDSDFNNLRIIIFFNS